MQNKNHQELENEDQLEMSVIRQPALAPAVNPSPTQTQEVDNGRFSVMAPYWLSGLHNKDGLALAEEVNKLVAASKLQEQEEAIKQLLLTYPTAKRFGIDVVPERRYLEDQHRKMNMAEPRSLLDGAFVRDKEGAYRPAAGGRAMLVDKGDTLVLKKGEQNLEAAIELAKAKGWTAISLTGKPKVVEAAWISAQLAGIEVINYTPSKEAQTKLAERLAQRPVTQGNYEGKILDVQGNQVIQKTGRDPDVFVRHNIANLSRVPVKNEVVGISYKDGKGVVSGKEVGKSEPAR